jgi:PKD repeat protein
VNEILFNDPLGEISGSWNRSSGGVVGTGGFNGVSNGGTFNATFAADAKHPAGPVRAYAITEGNLTIQDGVSAANGISSLVLAEILAHEFGHTLGFGHSADSAALMYATVTRTGPALRADDEAAARWLYPNGSSTPTPTTPVTPAVVAAFDVSSTFIETGVNVRFTDRSSGSPTSWSWSFGDGATSTSQNPTHAYGGPGSYTVTLTARNAATSSIATKTINVVSSAPHSSLISVAAQTGGVGGTSWRTELSLFNAGSQGASVSLVFLPTGGGNVTANSVFLSPNQSITYANALLDIFGIASGAGALAIEAGSAGTVADLRVTSRTFTTGPAGTYGQSVPDLSSDDLVKTLYVTGIESTSSYRTNIGLVNRGVAPVSATLTLFDATGSTIATRGVTLAANSFQQQAVGTWFPAVNGQTREHLTMRLVAGEATVSAYASVVDNLTQDPVYIQAVPASAGSSLTIPVVGRSPGANGTFWRSDVTLFNPSASRITLSVIYGGASKSLSINAGDTVVLADVLSEWGQTSGSGTLRVTWSGSIGPVVTSRTYTSVATGGTYGQSIDPVTSFTPRTSVPGLRNDAAYRSNVGFVNGGTGAESFTVRVLSQNGAELGRTTLTLNAGAQVQYPVSALFPGLTANPFTLQIEGDGDARLFAYGSMVDNVSGDPVFFAGR